MNNEPQVKWYWNQGPNNGIGHRTYYEYIEEYRRQNPNIDLFSGEVLSLNFPTNYSETLKRVKDK